MLLLLLCFSAVASAAEDVALHASYTLQPEPLYPLTHDAGDRIQLTDGEHVMGHFWSSKQAVGWIDSGLIRIRLDLGRRQSIGRICLTSARGARANVSFPQRIDVFAGDAKKVAYLGDLLQDARHGDGPYAVRRFCRTFSPVFARVVLLAVTPRGSYTFADEVEVFGGDSPGKAPDSSLDESAVPAFVQSLVEHVVKLHALDWLAQRLSDRIGALSASHAGLGRVQHLLAGFRKKLRETPAMKDGEGRADLYAAAAAAARQVYAEPLLVRQTDPWSNFTPVDVPLAGRPPASVELDSAACGHAYAALNITNNARATLRYRVAAEMNTPGAPRVQLRVVRSVERADGRVTGDALLPLAGEGTVLQPGETGQVFLETAAEDTKPRLYTGSLSIALATGAAPSLRVPLRIRVRPAGCGDTPLPWVNVWSYTNARMLKHRLPQALADLRAHHVNVFVIHPDQLPWPRAGEAGSTDYSKFDTLLRRLRGARLLFYMAFKDPRRREIAGARFMSPRWQALFRRWISGWSAHLRAAGLGYKDFAFYPVDEPEGAGQTRVLFDTARLIKSVDPRLRVFTTLGRLSATAIASHRGLVDIYDVLVGDLDKPALGAIRNAGAELWTYKAEGGGKRADPSAFYRLEAWQAFAAGADGIGFWAYADNGPRGTAWNDFDGTRPDFAVIYEGPAIVPSKRWEAWAAGVEDYRLLLQAHARPGAEAQARLQALIREVLRSRGASTAMEQARRRLLALAASAERKGR